jgi:hypothetical protein
MHLKTATTGLETSSMVCAGFKAGSRPKAAFEGIGVRRPQQQPSWTFEDGSKPPWPRQQPNVLGLLILL